MWKDALLATLWLAACSPAPERQSPPGATDQRGGSDVQAYAETAERGSTHLSLLSTATAPVLGQVFIDYGRPRWKPEYEDNFDELTKGKRWRFGNNSWSFLDTNVSLSLSGTEVQPGHYYLVLERSPEGRWYLVLLDPKPIRAQRLDAFFADEAPPGLRVPLQWTRTDVPTQKLLVRLIPVEGATKRAELEIRWGTHKLAANIGLGL